MWVRLFAEPLPPPGLIQSVEMNDRETVLLPLPFVLESRDPERAFSGQLENSGLILHQWDGGDQQWRTATYSPRLGRSGDEVLLQVAQPVLVQTVESGDFRLSLTGRLPHESVRQTIYPGLNLVGSPGPVDQPLSVWNWDRMGVAGETRARADTVFSFGNEPQAWLRLDSATSGLWSGFDGADSGTLLPGAGYFYHSQSNESFVAEGEVTPYSHAALPAITHVVYDAEEDRVLLTVQTAGGDRNVLDLFYQDVEFPESFTPEANWKILDLGVEHGVGDTFVIEDAGDENRPHPRTPSIRFYQVGDAMQDRDGDGVSDTAAQLLHSDSVRNETRSTGSVGAMALAESPQTLQTDAMSDVSATSLSSGGGGGIVLYSVSGSLTVDLENWGSSPWNLTGGDTSFSGTVNDPDFEGGTDVSFSFSDPRTGVDIGTPSDPDFGPSSASNFGRESSGFGVGGIGVGRFERGESFVIEADHAFHLHAIRWAEYQGDERVHLSWTSGGIPMSESVDFASGSFYTQVEFTQIEVDANTPLTITNVSDSGSSLNGRLRINRVVIDLISAPTGGGTTVEVGESHRLSNWGSTPWDLTGGDTSFSGSISDPDFGSALFTFSDPRNGVDVGSPSDPDSSSSSASNFGRESTGFGVGGIGVGRFDRGESFVMEADHAFELQTIRWAEYSGDETLHLSWTQDGVAMSATENFASGSFYTETAFSNILVDANTPLTLTNVSASGAHMSGRLRVNHIDVALWESVPSSGELFPGAVVIFRDWDLWPWHASGGDPSFSGTFNLPENGGVPMAVSFDNAVTGVDVTDPANPDFSSASSSYFGFETTGFGVGNVGVGRFARGDSFTIESGRALRLDAVKWREFNGDEVLHIRWTQAGSVQEQVFDIEDALTTFDSFVFDPNTEVTITNVSPASATLSGRLRVEYMKVVPHYTSAPTYDHSGSDGFEQMVGVNLAGAEFGGFAFWQTDPAQWDYYESKGLNLIRIPFKWERVQSSLYGSVDFTNLDAVVARANQRGMKVVLDMHNYARYNGVNIGSGSVPNAAFEDVWRQIADHYKNEPAIYGYGIMNEPRNGSMWPAAAQAAADGIRDVDSTNWIIVGGTNWSGAHSWRSSNATLDVQDPQDKVMYEAHCYFDDSTTGYSNEGTYGSYDTENPPDDIGVLRAAPFILWLQERGARGFFGEFGTPKDDVRWNVVLDEFMSYIHANGMSSTYWAGGKNWSNYLLDCSPTSNYTVDAIQIQVLEQYAD